MGIEGTLSQVPPQTFPSWVTTIFSAHPLSLASSPSLENPPYVDVRDPKNDFFKRVSSGDR